MFLNRFDRLARLRCKNSIKKLIFQSIIIILINFTINMAYKHTYSDYVNHILNNSPSKNTFTFPKQLRFKDNKIIDQHYLPDFQSSQQRRLSPERSYNDTYNYGRQRSSSREDKYIKIQDKTFVPRSRSKSYEKSRNGVRSKSQTKKYDNNPKGINKMAQIKGRQVSPNKWISHQKPSPSRYQKQSPHRYSPKKQSISNEKKELKKSPSKTYVQYLQQIDHPLKKMTPNGYYPLGVQLNPSGKYIHSQIKNTQSHKFGKSPSKLRYQYIQQGRQSPLGPGYYNTFSQFGQIKRK